MQSSTKLITLFLTSCCNLIRLAIMVIWTVWCKGGGERRHVRQLVADLSLILCICCCFLKIVSGTENKLIFNNMSLLLHILQTVIIVCFPQLVQTAIQKRERNVVEKDIVAGTGGSDMVKILSDKQAVKTSQISQRRRELFHWGKGGWGRQGRGWSVTVPPLYRLSVWI